MASSKVLTQKASSLADTMHKILAYACESEPDLTEVKGLLQSVSVAPSIMADLAKLPGGAGPAEKLQNGMESLSQWARTNVCKDDTFLAGLGDIIEAVDKLMPLPEGAGSGELNKLFTSFDFPVLPASLDHSFLLRCYVHATFSDGILATACSFLLEWATKTATEGSNVMDVLRPMEVMKKYLDFCLGNFKVGKLPEGEENGPRVMMKVHEAAFAVKGLLHRISAAQEGALFIALMEGELAGTEMMKDLPQDLASIAAIQEIDWEKEAASVTSDEADIAVFFAKMPRFETAEDAENEVQQDIESFKTVRQEFLELAGKVSGAMEQHGVSQSGDLKRIMMECQSFVDLGSGKARSGALYSALLLFSHCIVKRTGGDVQDVESYLKKSFGNEVALDKMPQKMITLVKEVVSESQSEKVVAGSGEKKQKRDKKEKKDKDKEKKSARDEKDQKGTKRVAAEEAKSKKEKKQKK
eukprot:symbB.v1.2.005552.t1/scaffold258.1/size251559/6